MPRIGNVDTWDSTIGTSLYVLEPHIPKGFAPSLWIWDSQQPWCIFADPISVYRIWGGGGEPYWGNPEYLENHSKLPKNYIRPDVTQIDTTTGGGQFNPREHSWNKIELPEHNISIWSKSIFDPHGGEFRKISPSPRSGHVTAWGRCREEDDMAPHW